MSVHSLISVKKSNATLQYRDTVLSAWCVLWDRHRKVGKHAFNKSSTVRWWLFDQQAGCTLLLGCALTVERIAAVCSVLMPQMIAEYRLVSQIVNSDSWKLNVEPCQSLSGSLSVCAVTGELNLAYSSGCDISTHPNNCYIIRCPKKHNSSSVQESK